MEAVFMRAVVLCHTAELSLVVLRALRANGVEPFVACEARIERVLTSSRACAGLLLAGDLGRKQRDLIDAVNGLHRKAGVDIVMACNVQGLRILHEISPELPAPIYPMPPLDALDVLDDKIKFYDLALRLGVAVPRSMAFESAETIDVGQVSRELGYPAAVKPTISWGSIGFRRIGSEAELVHLVADRSYAFRHLVVQEYVEGDDVGAGLFVRHGRVQAMATFRCGPRDAAEFISNPPLATSAERVVTATGCEVVINFDARLTPAGELRLLECNPRFFMRLRAARLCGLDLLGMGLPAFGGSPGKARGHYRPLGDVASALGLRQLLTGKWSTDVLVRTAAEAAADPLAILLGRLGSGRTRRPPPEPYSVGGNPPAAKYSAPRASSDA
jgi:hypothetical protein